MSKHTKQLTTNESVLLCSASRGTDKEMYKMTVFVQGGGGNAFGGGTVTLQASADNGDTKVTLRDVGGTVVSITADDVYNIELGFGGKLGQEIEVYATMVGATAPTVDVIAFDNR